MSIDLDQKKLEVLLKELENIRGRHTELVTVYIPAGYNLNKVAEQISNEKSTAQNIKSKPTRKNVVSALEKILAHLRAYKQTPKNGLAIFCGNVAKEEGVSDIEIWGIEPPEPVGQKMYRCDKEFVLGPLENIVREKEVYGIVVLDKSGGDIGILKGKSLIPVKHVESWVPGKTEAGGWSQKRYARIREEKLMQFLKKLGKLATDQFQEEQDLRGIIIAGPAGVKDQFAEGEFLHYELKKKIIGMVDTSYTGEPGLREALERSEDILSEASIVREKKVLERFFSELQKDSGLAAYGIKEVVQALEAGNLETILISEGFDYVKVDFKCSCGKTETKVLKRELIENHKCPKCESKMEIVKEHILEEEMIELAEKMGTVVEVISTDTEGGEQLKELGGIAGILRYKA